MGFFVEQFLEYLQYQRKYSSHTRIAYQNDLREFENYLRQQYEVLRPQDVKNDMVRSWVSALIRFNLEPVTVRRKISSLRSFYKYLRKEKIVGESPVSQIPLLKVSKKLPVTVAVENMDDLLDQAPLSAVYEDHLHYLIIALLYGTGFRRAELLGLQESNIDLAERQIKVLGKRNKERIVPITRDLSEQIASFIDLKRQEGLVSGNLFVTKKNKVLYPGYIYMVVKKYLTLHSVNGKRSPHILRHTYATRLLQNGAELLSVKELLGHSSLASTQVYTHVNIEDLKKIYKKNHPKQK